jgi:putative nucleotidyltransferase with HDIG domain
MTVRTDKEKYVEGLFPELQEIAGVELRKKVVKCWLIALEDGQWDRIEDMPWVPGSAEFITNVQHVRTAARIGIAIAKTINSSQDLMPGATVNLDTVIAGSILHDVGKLLEFTGPENRTGEVTPLGNRMLHHILGAHLAIKAGLDAEIVHCIEAHREPQTFPRSLEARIVLTGDMFAALPMVILHPEVKFRGA